MGFLHERAIIMNDVILLKSSLITEVDYLVIDYWLTLQKMHFFHLNILCAQSKPVCVCDIACDVTVSSLHVSFLTYDHPLPLYSQQPLPG